MAQATWTLDELTERVGTALSVGYDGQPSGRVRDLPDRRAIRWYTTIGLVDRPAATRGRTALYGPRHLLQLVAIKRLQARGLPLVAIQAELAGATDARLARVAQLPGEDHPVDLVPPPWQPAARDALPSSTHAAPAAPAVAPTPAAGVGAARPARFWRERPVENLGADLRAILDAARPLLEALRARGLDKGPDGHHPGREHP